LKKQLDRKLKKSEEWNENLMIEAHRTFLKSMSGYKLHRYGTQSSKKNYKNKNLKNKWIDTDLEFITVIENYNRVELYTNRDNFKRKI
jgi:hypothetical protein